MSIVVGMLAICVGLMCVVEGWVVSGMAVDNPKKDFATTLMWTVSVVFYMIGGALIYCGGMLLICK